MTRDDALLDNVAELVLQADDPRRLAERTLDVVCSLCNGRSGAVFAIEAGRLTLFASKSVEQSGLDASRAVWEGRRASLSRGEVFYVPDRSIEPQLSEEARSGPIAFALAPVLRGQELAGLLYVDSDDPHFLEPHDRARLARLAGVLVKAGGRLGLRRREPGRPLGPLPRAHPRRRHGAGEVAAVAESERVEHRPGRASDGRHAADDLPASGTLQHPSREGAEDPAGTLPSERALRAPASLPNLAVRGESHTTTRADLFRQICVAAAADLTGPLQQLGTPPARRAEPRNTPGIPGARRLVLTKNLSLSTRSTSTTDC